ncbi:MAG: nicotinate-nucleotide adenylyltransferase [Desulfobulbaceae bacterium]|nr:nicotinate-nucleotide adenylyltransferase [Desulfobulbaceae bacterium]
MKLGILGGTFDPIHLGHLRTAEEIGQELGLEKVYLIPSASPPHKTSEPVAPFHHRLTMARLAVGDSSLLEILDLEGKRPGFSYSIETLREFHHIFSPDPELFFILGIDAFLEIKTWKEYQKLFYYAHFVIIERAGFRPRDLEAFLLSIGLNVRKTKLPDVFSVSSGNTVVLRAPTLMDISSTRIRELVAEGKSIRFLLPEMVRNYIMEKGLYRDYAGPR